MLPACVLSCPTGCMNFGEREDMENLAEQRLAEVKERFPNAVLGDNGIVHVIYLYAEDPNLYHKFAVFAQNDANPMTRRQLFAKLRRPVA
ncbi:MAG: formate dehydrogenase, partial [Bilophila wadsworthia]